MMQYKITQKDCDIVRNYVASVYKTQLKTYERRGQTNVRRIIEQETKGKLAEIGVKNILETSFGIKVSKVDFNIYNLNRKSFNPDLQSDRYNFHIKTCLYKPETPSWTFSYSETNKKDFDGNLLVNPRPNDVLVLTLIQDDEVRVLAMIFATTAVKHNLYTKPDLERLHASKRVIRYSDLLAHGINLFEVEEVL